jgi:hypothetical protein
MKERTKKRKLLEQDDAKYNEDNHDDDDDDDHDDHNDDDANYDDDDADNADADKVHTRDVNDNPHPRLRGARIAMDEYLVKDSLLLTGDVWPEQGQPVEVDGDDNHNDDDGDDAHSVESGNDFDPDEQAEEEEIEGIIEGGR